MEYQVASHMMLEGMMEEGLAIVRGARGRHEGKVRNPFNEYECGSYYARAMASYALLSGAVRYSAVMKELWVREGDGRWFFSTATGFGVVTVAGERVEVEMVEGWLEVERVRVGDRAVGWGVRAEAGLRVGVDFFATESQRHGG
jgi:hypothetical protein